MLRETLWKGRRNNHTNLASLLVANTITGAATLFRREVAELALPFPEAPGWQFHDHWLGLVALASGEVAYVDRPLYDYVQHHGAVVGQAADDAGSADTRGPTRGWRAAYFYGYLPRGLLAQALLARCSGLLSPRKRRALRRFASADRTALGLAWLAARPLRRLAGRGRRLGRRASSRAESSGATWSASAQGVGRHPRARRTTPRAPRCTPARSGTTGSRAGAPPSEPRRAGVNLRARWPLLPGSLPARHRW